MWEELAESRWGRAWYSWRALVDEDGDVVSSLKLYRPLIRVGDASSRLTAIGAVFTPRPLRRGDAWSLLFTDIGTEYYRAFGFAPLPCEDAQGTLARAAALAPKGVSLRPMTIDDLDAVCAAHEAIAASRPIAIVRDREHWEFLLLRAASFFRRLDASGLSRRFTIAMESSRPIGYLIGILGPGEWNLREAAAFDGAGETLARILAAGAADAAAASATTVWGWIPRDVWPHVPAWRLRSQPRLRAIPMMRPPGGSDLPDQLRSVDGAFIPYLDQF